MHASAFNWAAKTLEGRTFNGVVEFGSRNVNGAIKQVVNHTGYYIGVDIKPGPDVDIVMDAADYQGTPVELVICMETLEHAENWAEIVMSASDNLLTGGWFVMTCAGTGRAPHSAVDGGQLRDGEYYQNIGAQDFKNVAHKAGLMVKKLEVRPQLGDLYVLAEKA